MESHRYDDGLEAASQNFPEVVPPQTHAYNAQQHQQYPEAYHDSPPVPKQTPSPYSPSQPSPGYGGATTIAGSTIESQAHGGDAHTTPKNDGKRRMICGCSLLTFVLSCIIALLSAAVIGLAAGTGIEASRANDAVHKLAAYTRANPVQIATTSNFPGTSTAATTTSTGSIGDATSPSGVEVDSGCGSRSDQVNGTTYTSLKSLDQRSYRIYCFRDYNRDTTNRINLVAIFTADFEACMDACASWTKYVVPKSRSNDPGWNCEAVSFIPAWVNRSIAEAGGYTGNCYLKTGPASIGKLEKNSNVHAALWQSG
ncbi:hypothetical protein GE21DRAFT_6674 [Neurospora crassa]|uniref:Uncharacterized protein n=1 Tax=Neurospora crassa (strain ATCC 24698 / 74-OR23-1A / CBS 708.71 / DSM 1257 / FGSC 987) TaxID=367110 RepID=Q7S887_NEUCR|nr:hypothetical protein NCU05256 [Neurospora crassa OR74A]EAA32557.2 hypothetical protein NCU05256 [Neurospora crassa OR74A]KHE85354.1 hypothetical protein GE21DRAFT_6674 [Neurospora crassa]|eukprot:XP_961793.2 hypothetical protein NCU05256 [Neurospora crassa OR74A]